MLYKKITNTVQSQTSHSTLCTISRVFTSVHRVQPTRCDVSQFIYFCKTLYMFQTVFPSIIRSSKLHIQRQAFVRLLLLPAASLASLATGSSNSLYVQFWAPDDGRKTRLKHVERLTEKNKLKNISSSSLYSANILAMHGPMNVKFLRRYSGCLPLLYYRTPTPKPLPLRSFIQIPSCCLTTFRIGRSKKQKKNYL